MKHVLSRFKTMFIKLILIFLCANISEIFARPSKKTNAFSACPELVSKYTSPIDNILGDWHVVLVIFDQMEEKFEERSVCIQGHILKENTTHLMQIWKLELPEIMRQDRTEIEFPTNTIQPGIWIVQSPLGGQFRGTIIDSDGSSYLLIVYCGFEQNQYSHMMTIAMSRSNIVTPNLRLGLMSALVQNGYDPFKNKVISWSDCKN